MKPAIFRDATNGDLVYINPVHVMAAVECRRGVTVMLVGNITLVITGTVGAMYNAFNP